MCRVEATARSSIGNYITNKSTALSLTFSPRRSCILTGPSLNQLRTVLSSPNCRTLSFIHAQHSPRESRVGKGEWNAEKETEGVDFILSDALHFLNEGRRWNFNVLRLTEKVWTQSGRPPKPPL